MPRLWTSIALFLLACASDPASDDVDDDPPIDTDTGESWATGTPPANPALEGDWNPSPSVSVDCGSLSGGGFAFDAVSFAITDESEPEFASRPTCSASWLPSTAYQRVPRPVEVKGSL